MVVQLLFLARCSSFLDNHVVGLCFHKSHIMESGKWEKLGNQSMGLWRNQTQVCGFMWQCAAFLTLLHPQLCQDALTS